ncbi:MAG: nuclear transport factor 2 family protein [Thalassotalea sp.]|nr:nuclear transport factor 2 family protein [Thalassotalea sp.]
MKIKTILTATFFTATFFATSLMMATLSLPTYAADKQSRAHLKAHVKEKLQLEQTLNDFLANSINNDFKNHNNFWADELIYTSSAGLRFDKAFIMKDLDPNKNVEVGELPPHYWAEEADIRVYGDIAIVAFKLMHKDNKQAKELRQTYYNTGTFAKRDGKWQAIAWQATKIPQTTEAK